MRVLASLALLLALQQLSSSLWIYLKANLAQVLIARAWEQGEGVKPWPWADTWPVGRLQVPRLGQDLFVLHGQQGNALAFGPGMVDDKVISGHRDTHFHFLQDLRTGDNFFLNRVQYEVVDVRIVDSSGMELRVSADLALVTCYPFEAITPGGPLRYVVDATIRQNVSAL